MRIIYEGAEPTESCRKQMKTFKRGLVYWGNRNVNYSDNRYFAFEGDILRAADNKKHVVERYMKPGYTLVSIIE